VNSSITDEQTALVEVLMPQMGTSIVEGTVVAWIKGVGDPVELDETICEISTDKVETECPSPAGGVLVEILVAEGETVEVGVPLARIATADAPLPPEPLRRVLSSPVARRIAAEHDVRLESLDGSGRGGRVTKRDVLDHIESRGAPAPEPLLHSDSPYEEPVVDGASSLVNFAVSQGGAAETLSRIRRSIATAMRRSQEIAATVHTAVECDMTAVESRRHSLGVTPLVVVARATIEALREFGDLNAWLDGETFIRFERVHLGVAVSLGADGLIVPVIRDAQNLSEQGLATAIRDLASRARTKKLLPEEARGATFTITSPGAAGAALATPVINLPEVAILDLEAITRRPAVITATDGSEALAIRSMANLVLGWDHRAVDGMYAAEFLSALRTRLEAATG
jgi:pyruvate/2-oxoglutarate dehydrogenase complex dihydrolipoamide acyltransferase (E2) component